MENLLSNLATVQILSEESEFCLLPGVDHLNQRFTPVLLLGNMTCAFDDTTTYGSRNLLIGQKERETLQVLLSRAYAEKALFP